MNMYDKHDTVPAGQTQYCSYFVFTAVNTGVCACGVKRHELKAALILVPQSACAETPMLETGKFGRKSIDPPGQLHESGRERESFEACERTQHSVYIQARGPEIQATHSLCCCLHAHSKLKYSVLSA